MKTTSFAVLLPMLSAAICAPVAARAGSEQVVYSFTGTAASSWHPTGSLTPVGSLLYGVTVGGTGKLFALDPASGTVSFLYRFDSSAPYKDAEDPDAGPILVGGKLYGPAGNGANGDGAFYVFDPKAGKESVLYSFGASASDGTSPVGQPIFQTGKVFGAKGSILGVTYGGGAFGFGTAYRFDLASATMSVLHDFTGADGGNPDCSLVAYKGFLYGTAYVGGSRGYGTVFRIDPWTGSASVLYSFQGGDDSYPAGPLIQAGGKFYGAALGDGTGYGEVFAIDAVTGVETVVHTFTGTDSGTGDGAYPYALTLQNGIIYGTTEGVDQAVGYAGVDGTLYSINTKTGAYQVLWYFPAILERGTQVYDRAKPERVTFFKGKAYGMTNSGGTRDWGSIFSYTP